MGRGQALCNTPVPPKTGHASRAAFPRCSPVTFVSGTVQCYLRMSGGSDPRAPSRPDLDGPKAFPPVLFLILHPVSNRKCTNPNTIERVFVKVEHAAVLPEDAAISSLSHQFCH